MSKVSNIETYWEILRNIVKPDVSDVGVIDKGVKGERASVEKVHVLHSPKCHKGEKKQHI